MTFNKHEWQSIANTYKEQLINETTRLISFKTVYDPSTITKDQPFGQANAKCLQHMLDMARQDGFSVTNYNHYAGTIEYGTADEIVGVACHLDVVDADSTQWNQDPFVATIKDNIIYGRGSNDSKGPTIAAYLALKILADLNLSLSKSIHIILGCNEESGMACMDYYLSHTTNIPSTGFVSDCTFPVNFGEHGSAVLTLTLPKPSYIDSFSSFLHKHIISGEAQAHVVAIDQDLTDAFAFYAKTHHIQQKINDNQSSLTIIGKSAHGSRPYQSINATYHLLNFLFCYFNDEANIQLIKCFEQTNGINLNIHHASYRYGSLSIAIIGASIKDDNLIISLDCRYPSHLDIHTLYKTINKQILSINPQVTLTLDDHSDGFFVDPNNQLVKTLEAIYQDHYDDHGTFSKVSPGDTYARKFKGRLVGFGPTTSDHLKLKHVGQAHQPNEGMAIDTLLKAVAIYCDALYQLAK
jgi:succinyl-diaminopimelate desuccinylase